MPLSMLPLPLQHLELDCGESPSAKPGTNEGTLSLAAHSMLLRGSLHDPAELVSSHTLFFKQNASYL